MEHINISFWVLQTLAMMITALLLPNLTVSGPIGALIAVVGLAFMNAHLWDAALFFSIPDSLTVHTIVLLLANGALFWILVKVLPGIEIKGFLPAILAPIVFTFTSLIFQHYGKKIDWEAAWKAGASIIHSARDELRNGQNP